MWQIGAEVLDTRGYLYYRLRDFDAALGDLHLAVQALEWVVRAMPWLFEIEKHNVTDIRPAWQRQQQWKRSLAVILYHRALVLEALGRPTECSKTGRKSSN